MNKPNAAPSLPATSPSARGADLLALGFGTTALMWATGYFLRMPTLTAPSWMLLFLMVAWLVAGGFGAGFLARRGLAGALVLGLLVSTLNLLILGSLLTGDEPNRIIPSALVWIPGSYAVTLVLMVAGALVGRALAKGPQPPVNWTAAFGWVTAGTTLLLLTAGGLVTGHEAGLAVVDWPNSSRYMMFLYPLSKMTGGIYYEHAHRLLGSLVGLTVLVLALYLTRSDDRGWLKGLVWGVFAIVVVQGILGGLRVTGRLTLSDDPTQTLPNTGLAIVHGVLGQIVFGGIVALAVFTSRSWMSPAKTLRHHGVSMDRTLTGLLLPLLVLQLILGAFQRHIEQGLLIHVTFAVVVTLLVLVAGMRVWGLHAESVPLRRTSLTLMILVVIQLILGFAALIAINIHPIGTEPHLLDVIITTLHQITGALLLAGAVVLTLYVHRILELQPREELTASAATE